MTSRGGYMPGYYPVHGIARPGLRWFAGGHTRSEKGWVVDCICGRKGVRMLRKLAAVNDWVEHATRAPQPLDEDTAYAQAQRALDVSWERGR